ncbi:hypothetical protein P7C70_g7380, partial [Phenoliferia sp. Uapishka_3]
MFKSLDTSGMGLMSEELWEVWRALGDLGAVAFVSLVAAKDKRVTFVQHDCISQECGIDAVGGITMEEREGTAIRKPLLPHNHPQDNPTKGSFIHNSHLIHSDPLLHHLYPRIPRAPAPTNIANTAVTFGKNLGNGFEEVAEKAPAIRVFQDWKARYQASLFPGSVVCVAD